MSGRVVVGCVGPYAGEMQAAGLELGAGEAEPVDQHPLHDGGLLLVGVTGDPLEVEVVGLAFQRPGAHGETELDVRLDLAGVGRSVEQSEFHRALREEGVEVDAVIPGAVVVLVTDAAGVAVVAAAVPNPLSAGLRLGLVVLHGHQESLGHFVAPAVGASADLEGFVEEVLSADGEVEEAGQALGGVPCAVHMDVDAAALVREGSLGHQGADDVLEVFHVFVLKDGRNHFAGVVGAGGHLAAVAPLLGLDAGVGHCLPGAALAVRGAVGLVVGPEIGAGRSVVVGDNLGSFAAGDSGHFDFDAEVLSLDGGVFHFVFLLFFVGVCFVSFWLYSTPK